MYGVSIAAMSTTILQTVSNLFLGGVGAAIAWAFVTFVQQLKKIYDHVVEQDKVNQGFTNDLSRIEKESKDQYVDLKDQITDMRDTFETKLDNLAKELRKNNQ